MPLIHHHPDARVRVKNASQIYHATLTDFAADYGSPMPALPAGECERFYEQGVIHYTSDGSNQKAAPEGKLWPEGDAIITALPTLLTKQTARLDAARVAAEAARQAAQQAAQEAPPSAGDGG